MEIESSAHWWVRDKREYIKPVVVFVNCNQAMKLGISMNELDDLPLDLTTAEYAPCIPPE